MIFHYAGKYNGDESSLPYKEHHPNATPFTSLPFGLKPSKYFKRRKGWFFYAEKRKVTRKH